MLDGTNLYVVKEAVASYNEAFAELSRLVGGGAMDFDVIDFLTTVTFTKMSGQDAEAFMEKRGYGPLPDSEKPWQVGAAKF